MTPSSYSADDLAAKIVSEALSINPGDLTMGSQIYDVPTWDSLGQLRIVLALEDHLGCSIDDEEVFEKLTNYTAIRQFVAEKLKEKSRDTRL